MTTDNSQIVNVELSVSEVRFLIDVMWGHSRHDSQALAFRHGINDNSLESRLSHIVADIEADESID